MTRWKAPASAAMGFGRTAVASGAAGVIVEPTDPDASQGRARAPEGVETQPGTRDKDASEDGAVELAEAYREHYRSLVRFLYRQTGDQAEAEDLAQEAFVRALEHRPERPRPWLFRVATNLVRDEGRKKAVRRRHLALVQDEQARAATPAPDVELSRRQTVARVRAALEELSARDRDCLLLQEEGLSYEEIAEVTGLAVGSIGTTLSRARRRLAEAFEEVEGAAGRADRRGGR